MSGPNHIDSSRRIKIPEDALESSIEYLSIDTQANQNSSVLSQTSDSFGDQSQNISRDQILQLFHKVQNEQPAQEKELLSILKTAIGDLAHHDNAAALEAYQEVERRMGHENDSTENPQPSRTENGTNIFDDPDASNYTFHADYTQSIFKNEINAPGAVVKIHAASPQDTVTVKKLNDGRYHVTMYKNGSHEAGDRIYYTLSGPPSRIEIHAPSQNISKVVPSDDTIVHYAT